MNLYQKKNTDYLLFEDIYSGYAKIMHNHTLYINQNQKQVIKPSLNFPKQIAEDMASIIVGKGVEIYTYNDNKTEDEEMKKILEDILHYRLKEFVEYVMGIGQGTMLPYIDENKKVQLNFLKGSDFKVIAFSHNKPIELEVDYDGYKEVYKQTFDTVQVFKVSSVKGKVKTEKIAEFEGEIPYFKPNIANNLDLNGYGIPIYANSLNILNLIDTTFYDMGNEFALSRKRIFVPQNMLESTDVNDNGEAVKVKLFDEESIVFQQFSTLEGAENNITIKETGGTIRTESYISAINYLAKLIGDKSGLDDYYTIDDTGFSTAEQARSRKSKLYRTKTDHQTLIANELKKVVRSVAYLSNISLTNIDILFDESIIIDDEKERAIGMEEVKQGLRSQYSYMVDILDYTHEEAEDELRKIKEAKNSGVDTTTGTQNALLQGNTGLNQLKKDTNAPAIDGADYDSVKARENTMSGKSSE